MPKRKKYKKEKIINLAKKFPLLAVIAVVLLGIFFSFLDKNNILSYENISVLLGLSDGALVENYEDNDDVYVHYIDVGQGDSVLIQASGINVLIDSGEAEYSSKLSNYLVQNNVERLDYVIVSHPHSDHMGGMSDIISEFEIGKIIMSEIPDNLMPTTIAFENLLNSIKEKNLKITLAKQGNVYTLGANVFLEIIMPNNITDEDLNNYSVVCRLVHDDNTFLFTGDAENFEEKLIIEDNLNVNADVLKVGHHGSGSSSSQGFLEAIRPKFCIISCGADNKYGHPNKKALSRIKVHTNQIYRTDLEGTIICISDGYSYNFKFEKDA